MLTNVQSEAPQSLTTPKLTPEQLVESWRLSRKGDLGFREGTVATPSGEIKEVEACCWAQVPSLLQGVQSPGQQVKVCFPNLGDEAVSFEQREIRKFLQRCHGKDFSEYGQELAKKIDACASFKKACAGLPPGLGNAKAWIEAHGLNYAGPKASLIVTDIRLGSDLARKGLSEAQTALSEHIDSKRPLVTIVHPSEAAKVVQLMAETIRDNKALSPALDTAKVWIFGPEDSSGKRNAPPQEVSLREFISDSGCAQPSNPGPGNLDQEREPKKSVAVGGEHEKTDDDQANPLQRAGEPSSFEDATSAPEPESDKRDQESRHVDDGLQLNCSSDDHQQPGSESDGGINSSQVPHQQHEATGEPPAPRFSEPIPAQNFKIIKPDSTLAKLSAVVRAKEGPDRKPQKVIQAAAEALAKIANLTRKERKHVDSDDLAEKKEGGAPSPEPDEPTLGEMLEKMIPVREIPGDQNAGVNQMQTAHEILQACRVRSIRQNIELLRDDLDTLIELRSQTERRKQVQRGSTNQDHDLVLLPNKGNVLFLSDIEGNVDLLAKIIDERSLLAQWREGAGDYLCILGDCVDRSETGSLLIDFILQLKIRAGGGDKVVLIAGNHELSPELHMPTDYNWSFLSKAKDKGLLADVFARGFGAESDAREHGTALEALAQLAPLPEGFPAKDAHSDVEGKVAARWGLYVLYNSIFHALPKSVLAEKVLFAVHGCIPTDTQLPERSSDDDRKKALALPSAEDIGRMVWSDVEDSFDDMSEAQYRQCLKTWADGSPNEPERNELVARSTELYAASGGGISLVAEGRVIVDREKGLKQFTQTRDEISLYVCGKALEEFLQKHNLEMIVRGHQKKAKPGYLPLGTVLQEAKTLKPGDDIDLPWVYKNVYTVEGSKQGWVLRVNLDPSAANRREVLKFQ